MLGEVRLLPETFATLDGGAAVRARIGVDSFVLEQGALLLEVFPAGETLEQSEIGPFRFVRSVGGAMVGLVPTMDEIWHCVLLQGVSLFHSGGHPRKDSRFVQVMM